MSYSDLEVLDSIPAGLAVLDRTGLVLYVNRLWEGVADNAFVSSVKPGKNLLGTWSSADRSFRPDALLNSIRSVLRGKCERSTHVLKEQFPGSDDSMELEVSRYDLDGEGCALLMVQPDKRQERLMKERNRIESEDRMRLALGAVEAGIWDWLIDTNELLWDDQMFVVFGIDPATSVTYETWQSAVLSDDIERAEAVLQEALESSSDFVCDFRIQRATDGEVRVIRARALIVRDEVGKAVRATGVNWDVTEEVEAKEEIRMVADRARLALGAMEGGVWDWDVSSGDLLWDEGMFGVFGIDPATPVTYETWRNSVLPEDIDAAEATLLGALETSHEFATDFRILRASDGTVRHIRARALIARNEDGEAVRATGVNWDVTDEIEAKAELDATSQRLQLALSAANAGVWDWQIKDETVVWDEHQCAIFGRDYSESQLSLESWKAYLHPADLDRIELELQQALNGEKDFDTTFRIRKSDADGVRHIRAHGFVVFDSSGNPVRMTGLNWDVTTEVLEQDALLARDRLLRQVSSMARVGAWSLDLVQNKLEWSEVVRAIHEVDEDFVPQVENAVEFYVEEDRDRIEAAVKRGIDEGVPWDGEFRIRTAKGRVTWVRALGKVAYEQGKPVALYGAFQDIDLIKRAQIDLERSYEVLEERVAERTKELESARERSEAANRSKSTFLATMSHEIRTPLNAIIGFAQVMQLSDDLSNDDTKSVETILASGNHLLGIINDVLELARIESGKVTLDLRDISLSLVCSEVVGMFEDSAAEKGLDLSLEVVGNANTLVSADATKLRQIVSNIVGNGIKFTEVGSVKLVVGSDLCSSPPSVFVDFTDTGVGIASEDLSRVFNYFDRGRGDRHEYAGSGIGLAIASQYAQMMDGTISVQSEVGSGSTFRLTMPVICHSRGSAQSLTPVLRSDQLDFSRKLVMIVDDKSNNRRLIRLMLSKTQVRIVECSGGEEAIEQCDKELPDLILMDVMMPGMDGLECTTQILSKHADNQPTIVGLSAKAFNEDEAAALNVGMKGYLRKPVVMSDLLALVTNRLTSQN